MTKYYLLLILSLLMAAGCSSADEVKAPTSTTEKRGISSYEDCVAAGFPSMRSLPPKCSPGDGTIFVQGVGGSIRTKQADKKNAICEDLCGNGVCEQMVCMAEGCPCAETPANCARDCAVSLTR